MRILLMLFIVFIMSSCQNEMTPSDSLREYIDYRFSQNQSKEELLGRLTGKIYSKVDEMDEVEFEKFSNSNNLKKKKTKILIKNCELKKCFITYTIKYEKLDKKNKLFSVETKKIAELLLVDGLWKIANVNDIKTFYDSHQEITP